MRVPRVFANGADEVETVRRRRRATVRHSRRLGRVQCHLEHVEFQ